MLAFPVTSGEVLDMSKEPLETSVNEGLAKMHEAGELIPKEAVEELAEKARKDAEEERQRHRARHES